MVTQEFSRDTAGNAKRFLAAVIEDLPCPLQPVQVDGGSEFRIQDAGELSVREAGHALAGCRHFCN
ncbi:MAG: hypothetical protein F4X92_01530 [Gammaproteobacteria bacterium]|nr:hypothetical protein [Gammaproteobacteria bacterium]